MRRLLRLVICGMSVGVMSVGPTAATASATEENSACTDYCIHLYLECKYTQGRSEEFCHQLLAGCVNGCNFP